MREKWYAYLVECKDGTLYTGAAKDVEKRVSDHNKGIKCKYTRSRRPVKLVYSEICGNCGIALRREAAIKKLSRQEKYINTMLMRASFHPTFGQM